MDWVTGLQKAIDYIEEHLTEPIDYAEAAKQACSSSFHFQRVFGILCGFTVGEYIRSRRLTRAGSELASGACRVIDAALKYGYDSPESFSRAFSRFHGITPSEARSGHAGLRSFSRLSVKLILTGGTMMDYRMEKKDAFQVAAVKVRVPRGAAGSAEAQDICSGLWKRCMEDGTIKKLCRYVSPDGMLGNMLAGISLDHAGEADFDYAVGAAYEGVKLAEGLTRMTIPACTWLIFSCRGRMPDAFQEMMRRVYTEFFPASEYQPAGGMCLELYPDENVEDEDYCCEFWISAEKK